MTEDEATTCPVEDIEDVIAVVDGRATESRADVPRRHRKPFSAYFCRERFTARCSLILISLDAVAGHLPGDRASQARLPLVLARMRAIANAA